MNTLIKKLASQAADEIADLFNPGFFDDKMVNDVEKINKKFAELIVLECAQIADKAWAAPGYQIKQHFGVEP
jgi:hypothetical protein